VKGQKDKKTNETIMSKRKGSTITEEPLRRPEFVVECCASQQQQKRKAVAAPFYPVHAKRVCPEPCRGEKRSHSQLDPQLHQQQKKRARQEDLYAELLRLRGIEQRAHSELTRLRQERDMWKSTAEQLRGHLMLALPAAHHPQTHFS